MTARFPRLERIRVGGWRGVDLAMIRDAASLSSVYLEGRRQKGTLAGIERCSAIERLVSIDYAVSDSSPLRPLGRLREVKLLAMPPTEPHEVVRFSDLAAPVMERIWIANALRIEDFAVLKELPRLREIRLINCPLRENDLRELRALPSRVKIDVVGPPHPERVRGGEGRVNSIAG
ncbi:hypothetical protein FNH05_31115 [Amycolatopsis rhizosphaerae]|uniref:Leucine-rich repeat domain-containing protein n=1 Tax=Amycolatopsis rhizosphaerae TaxID=2053003 RepID=A0A558ARF0_9PSEU|nr:hypothetical protein [Amycolatopsis rhizosphaerae]TVT26841.1 hypothetical protein FNH05_31115 [Amycolatopsis rhizosphaerae]